MMSSPASWRALAVAPFAPLAGIALIATGLALGGGWLALAAFGLLPLATGVLDLCPSPSWPSFPSGATPSGRRPANPDPAHTLGGIAMVGSQKTRTRCSCPMT